LTFKIKEDEIPKSVVKFDHNEFLKTEKAFKIHSVSFGVGAFITGIQVVYTIEGKERLMAHLGSSVADHSEKITLGFFEHIEWI